MLAQVIKSTLNGNIEIPASKSHTIRAIVIASLAEDKSLIRKPLYSRDTLAAKSVYSALGARFESIGDDWEVTGTGGKMLSPDDVLNVLNSGTTMYIALCSAALIDGYSILTGDKQIRTRPAGALINAINKLGGEAISTRGNGCPPIVIKGRIKGGSVSIECPTSQYLTSLLINCPLAQEDTIITVPLLNEQPYVDMTIDWLKEQKIEFDRKGYSEFRIKGSQKYKSFNKQIPGDFSSATFFAVGAAITGGAITLENLDINDSQGDKAVISMLEQMGATAIVKNNSITVTGGDLHSGNFDLNATPDALPAMSIAAVAAQGTTKIYNVQQARLKETDRISVMASELSKLGAQVKELPDGLEITGSKIKGTMVDGNDDHRVVMALSLAGLIAEGETIIETAESVDVTFPEFFSLLQGLGGNTKLLDNKK